MTEPDTTDGTEQHREPDHTELRRALTEHADPVASVSPEYTGDDLDPIGEVAADVDVFGMGEASHGTREFFRAKHRLFRFLVREHGFRLLGIEANFAAGLAINEYVQTGEGSAEEVLAQGSIHGVYKTDSFLEFVEWIRRFNDGRADDDKISVHGFDMQDSVAAATRLQQYFERVDPDVLEDVASEIERLSGTHYMRIVNDEEQLAADIDARKSVVTHLGDALETNEQAYTEQTTVEAYERATRLVWQLEQGRRLAEAILEDSKPDNLIIRDKAMAKQTEWLLAHESAEQIAIWGHNAHLAREGLVFSEVPPATREQIPSLGTHLADSDDIEYFALQLSLGGGTVLSFYVPEQEGRAYEIDDPPAGSLPAVCSDAEEPMFFLNTRELPRDSPLGEWFDSSPVGYIITGAYEETPVGHVSVDPSTEFDGLLFIEETSAADIFLERQ